jgi:flagellar motor switch protein FliM
MSTDGVSAKEPERTADVAPIDFRRLDELPRSQFGAIQAVHENLTGILGSNLSLYLRSTVSASLTGVEEALYGDFVDALQTPTCTMYLTMQPYERRCLVEIEHSILFPVLDLVLGGKAQINNELTREITDIEQKMLESFFDLLASSLGDAWSAMTEVSFAFESIERKPRLSKEIGHGDAVVIVRIQLQVGECVGGINLVIPAVTLKVMTQESEQHEPARRPGQQGMEERIGSRLSNFLKMDLELGLSGASLTLTDLLAIKVGDVLDLRVVCDGKATVLVNGRTKFKGALIGADGNRGLLVEGIVMAGDSGANGTAS